MKTVPPKSPFICERQPQTCQLCNPGPSTNRRRMVKLYVPLYCHSWCSQKDAPLSQTCKMLRPEFHEQRKGCRNQFARDRQTHSIHFKCTQSTYKLRTRVHRSKQAHSSESHACQFRTSLSFTILRYQHSQLRTVASFLLTVQLTSCAAAVQLTGRAAAVQTTGCDRRVSNDVLGRAVTNRSAS